MLQTKLTAAQQAQKIQVPGSAIKSSAGRGVLGVLGAAAAQDQAWSHHVKEELYGDLTNLMIMGAKKEGDSRIFDCLQSGANGGAYIACPQSLRIRRLLI